MRARRSIVLIALAGTVGITSVAGAVSSKTTPAVGPAATSQACALPTDTPQNDTKNFARAALLTTKEDVFACVQVRSRQSQINHSWPFDSAVGTFVVDKPGLRVGGGETSASTTPRGSGSATGKAKASAQAIELLGGLITATDVRRSVTVDSGKARFSGSVKGLVIAGETIGDVATEQGFDLPNSDGTVIINDSDSALTIALNRAVAGVPAGSVIRVATVAVKTTDGSSSPSTSPQDPSTTTDPAVQKPAKKPKLARREAPKIPKSLTKHGFAFPVYGEVQIADDFGADRQIGAHQGNDIFASFGAPVIAVADGVVHKVGTLPISGNRLWVYTNGGDAFFYCHLSAFAPAAVNGNHVKAGTVLGFVGNTGDAEPTPPHLHFEIHPGGEKEDAIDPHKILNAWRGREDVPSNAWLTRYGKDTAARPGVLVQLRDPIAES